jgi:hypothetical protein
MPIMAFIARDHALGVATILFAIVVYVLSVTAALQAPRAFFRISMAETAAIALWTVVIVNWRWDAWMAAYRRTSVYDSAADLPLWAMNTLLGAVFLMVFVRLAQLDRVSRRAPGAGRTAPRD